MSSPPEDAQLALPGEAIAQLALLYDRFANALDPYASERDQAEMLFEQEIARYYDVLPAPKPDIHTFKKAIIVRCRRHLKATDKPSSL